MGFKTYVVERNPTIGGRMGQLDKTFPTLDCSMCILAPKMVDCAKHENIELISYAEVKEVDGFIGNFKVKVEKKPRYVDESLCTGCGSCQEACPIEIPNYYDEGVGMVKAAFIPFPQAVPLCATIDKDYCIECNLCVQACGPDAIDHNQQPEEIELEVGTIVAAGHVFDEPRYLLMIPTKIEDDTGEIQVTFFDNLAEELIGMKKEEIISLVEDGYGIEDKLQDLNGQTIEIIANVSFDEFNEENRLNPKKILSKYY